MGYESWPAFCSFDERFGHVQQECYRKYPALKPAKNAQAHLPQGKDPLPKEDQGTTMARGEDVGERRDIQQSSTGTEAEVGRSPLALDHEQLEAQDDEVVQQQQLDLVEGLVQTGDEVMQ